MIVNSRPSSRRRSVVSAFRSGTWSTADDRYCGDAARGIRIYCHPKYFTGLANSLYRNRGDGTFEDVTAKAGLAKFPARGMSVAFADYDGDGRIDAFVTNDTVPNFLFHNDGNDHFTETAVKAGVAFNDDGRCLLYTSDAADE